MLRIESVEKRYAKSGKPAVENLTLHVEHGEVFGFIGANGAGKTTTIKMITGILLPDKGRVIVNDQDMRLHPVEAKRCIGYVPDNHEVYERISGWEYLNFMADIYGVGAQERKERLDTYLAMFELREAITDPVKSYSHGMKQKLCVIGALLHQPPLWVLDEPLTGLDPTAAHRLKELMREHCRQGNTVFFSTHVLEVAEKLCDRVGIIDQGRLVAVGTLDELRAGQSGSLEELFFRLVGEKEE